MKQYNVIQQVFPANPRSKKRREMVQGGSSSLVGGFSGAGASVPQYWRLVSTNAEGVPLGEGKEYIEAEKSVHTTGSFVAEGEIVAFATDEAIPDVSFPLASPERLGMVKIGSGLTVTAEGVLSALEGGGGISFTPGTAIRLTDDNVLNVVFGTTNATACAGNDVRLSDARPNPFALTFTGYSTGTYTGVDVLSVAIPDNTDQLVNGAGFITGISKPMVLNALTGSGSRSKYLAGDGTFYTVSYAELSGRPDLSVYVTLGSDQTITGLKHFTYGLTAGNKSSVWMQLLSGNVINGMNKTSVGDLYLNYVSQYKNVRINGNCDLTVGGDIACFVASSSISDVEAIASSSVYGLVKIDNSTIKMNASGQLYATVSGGGAASSAWADITGKPSWIGSSKPSYSWGEITGKPSWIGAYKPSYSWSEIAGKPSLLSSISYSVSGSGNVVTNVTTSGGTVYVTKGTVSGGGSGGSWNGGTVTSDIVITKSAAACYLRSSATNGWRIYQSSGDSNLYFNDVANASYRMYLKKNGNLYIAGTLSQSSDMRGKERIGDFGPVLSKIMKLDVFDYRDISSGEMRSGISAQQLKSIYPQFVEGVESDDSYLCVNYINLAACVAIKGLQEMNRNYESLKSEWGSFKSWCDSRDRQMSCLIQENALLKARMDELERRVV